MSVPVAVYNELASRDWTFARAKTRSGVHGLHPYPAKFIPQIPRALIRALHPGDETAVLDPFCGSGTTLVEAVRAGRRAVGVDLNPLACLVSRVKCTPLEGNLVAAADRVVQLAETCRPRVPEIPRLDHWFDPDVQVTLAGLVEGINAEPDQELREALRVALSSIIVRVSRQESDTRYAAIDKAVARHEVVSLFQRASASIAGAIAHEWPPLFKPIPPAVINKNVLKVTADEIGRSVSLVVTSPPYPNAYEYWLYHKYRMYWLGMDPIEVRSNEIGARPHYFKKVPQTSADFERQLSCVFELLAACIVDGGHACFQVGNSKIHGQIIDNTALLRRAAVPSGFTEVATLAREIPRTRSAFNPNNARIRRENIVVFKLER